MLTADAAQSFLKTGKGVCPFNDEDQDGYSCCYELQECTLSRQVGRCPRDLVNEARRETWRRAVERQEQDPYGLGLPLDDDLRDDPFTNG